MLWCRRAASKIAGTLQEAIRDLQNRYALAPRQQTEKQRNQWNLCSAFYNAYYTYSDQLIQSGTGRELSEDTELIKTLSAYLPR